MKGWFIIMRRIRRILSLCLGTVIGAVALFGCSKTYTDEEYATTVVATFGDQDVYLYEVNFYLKVMQVTYDTYYDYYYSTYYGFSSKEEFYEYTGLTENGETFWEAIKEDAMATLMQTYILCYQADEYGISLSDEDIEKVEEAVETFLSETDEGVISACKVDEEKLTKIFTDNALANRVYEYIVSDIDTEVDEEEYRYTEVAYLEITESDVTSVDTSSNDDDEEEEEEVDYEAKAEEVLAALQEQMEIYLESGEDDDTIPFEEVVSLYENSTEISVSYTESTEYSKPDDDEEESLQTICWNDLETGDYTIWYDEDSETAYVIYCINDDVEDSKEAAIEEELESRRTEMFEEKYPDIVESSPDFKVVASVYDRLAYQDIEYASDTDTSDNDVDATDNDASDNDASENDADASDNE